MNNLKKQILSYALAATMLTAALPATAASVPSDVLGTRYEKPVQILAALGIMNGDENGEFRLDDTIIRSEVAKMAIHAMGLEDAAEASKGQTIFDDVSTSHWANGYINLAVSQGLIEGDGDGNFRPNAPISYAEAMAIMIRATGYEISAENKGGYPQGYIQVANAEGFTKNVQGSASEEISRGNVAYLTTNALEVNLMEQTGFGNNANYEVTDKTLLKDHLDVTKGTGQVTAIESTSLTGSSGVGKNKVKIGDDIFETAYSTNELLGYKVEYYLQEDNNDSKIILALPLENQNSDLTVTADMFSKLTEKNGNTAVEYFKDENSSKTATVEIESDAVLIYNGRYEEMNTDLIDLTDESGKIKLLDTDKNGKYDVVFAKTYENIVVEEVTSTNKIVDKYSQTTLKLDDSVEYRLTKGLEAITPADLKEFDVLSVSASLDKELYNIEVSNKTVEGKVTGKDSKHIIIDGEKYKVAANYTDEISIGTEGTFYLDIDGKIAAVDSTSLVSSNYGYLTRAFFSADTDRKATFRIFSKDGKDLTLEGTSKIKVNGKSGVSAEEAVASLNIEDGSTTAQLVTYTVNSDGKLSAINTAFDNTASGGADESQFTKNAVLSDAKFSKSLSKLGNVRINENTVIFDISEDSEEFAIRDMNVFEDGQKYNAVVYDMQEDYTARAIVVTNANFNAAADSSIAVVKEVIKASNSDDEQTDMLIALVDGKEVSILAEDENVLKKSESPLEEGDIIQFKTNSDDEIASIRVLFDITTKDTEKTEEPVEKLQIVYGKVSNKFTNSINVTVNGESSNYSIPSDVTVYSVDTTISKNNITVAEVSDIQKYDEEENNRVFIKIYDDEVKEIVIIK